MLTFALYTYQLQGTVKYMNNKNPPLDVTLILSAHVNQRLVKGIEKFFISLLSN